MTEHHLYPEIPLLAAARRTDPPTSHAAAARAPVSEHCRRILDALAAGPAGQIGVAVRTGLTVAQVSKRLSELRRKGHIERTGREVAAGECEYRISPASR
jgi:predicted Rossmann fold nucleotide-binding protein DprA/Smf involved in DNA uptake